MVRCRLFIDEVGNDDVRVASDNDNERYLSLTGIITKQSFYSDRFQPDVLAFKHDIFGEAASSLVLHRREIIRREGVFKVLMDEDTKTRFDDGLLKLFRDLPYLATTVAIDKKQHLDMYKEWLRHPYHYCLVNLIERYVLWMRRHGYSGDVSIEPRNPKPDRAVKEAFSQIYDKGTDNIPQAIVQNHLTSREIKFINKRSNCPAMQIVDLIAHPSIRAMKFDRLGLNHPDDYGTKVVDVLERWKYARHPTTKIREGWGKKWLPK